MPWLGSSKAIVEARDHMPWLGSHAMVEARDHMSWLRSQAMVGVRVKVKVR